MPTNPQIEAEARDALIYAREACARSLELRDQMEVANEFRIGQYDGLPDIQMRVAAYLAGRSAALSLRPTSQDDAELCERLRTKRQYFPELGGGSISTDGRVTSYTIDDGMRLVNPDGPEAAARIATLSADVERMREALAEYDAKAETCPYVGLKTPSSRKSCLKCGATRQETCGVMKAAAFTFVLTVRAALSGDGE